MFCKKCGKELKDGALFCTSCGQKVLMPVPPASVRQPVQRVSVPKSAGRSKSTVNLIPVIAAGILLIAVAAVGYFLWSKRSDAPSEDDEVIETMVDSVVEELEKPAVSEEERDTAPAEPAEEPEEKEPVEESNSDLGNMKSYFFDCIVRSAYLSNEFEGYHTGEGNTLLVANITVTNTFKEEIKMYDTDFQAQWGGEGEDDFSVPITYDGTEEGMDVLRDNQLPGVYSLQPRESRTGLLVFEIPKNRFELSISYMEAFDDDTTGETYFINFHIDPPEEQSFLPTSSSEYLTMSDLEGFSQDDCRMARNELYARHGRRFDDPNLQAYFDALDWYEGTIAPSDFDESVMNEYEIANRDLIVQYEKDMGYR